MIEGLFIVVIILLFILKNQSKHEFSLLRKKLEDIEFQIDRLKLKGHDSERKEEVESIQNTESEINLEETEIFETDHLQELPKFVKSEIIETDSFEAKSEIEPQNIPEPYAETEEKHESFWTAFNNRNPDLENFIGSNLISKIGIAILVLGIAFFVKYAIDKNWINESARVGIGILAGLSINAVAHRMRKSFAAFSSILVSGAIATYYFTITIAFQEYHLFSQSIAFVIMVCITAFSVLLSISYKRQELAVLSLIGGFLAPVLISTGQSNYMVLFTYLIILNTGILFLASKYNWKILKTLDFILTYLYLLTWMVEDVFLADSGLNQAAFIFLILFYLLFTALILLNDIVNHRISGSLEFSLLISNNVILYACGMIILSSFKTDYKGLFTALLAVFNLGIGSFLYAKHKADKTLIYLIIGLALTFATLAAPIQLEGNHITLFWAAESVLLLWLSLKSELRKFFYASMIVSLFMLGSLVLDWTQFYGGFYKVPLQPIFNKIFLTGLFAFIAFVVKSQILKKHQSAWQLLGFDVNAADYRKLIYGFAVFLLYVIGLFELYFQTKTLPYFASSQDVFLLLYHLLYCTVLIVSLRLKREENAHNLTFVLSYLNIVLFILVFHTVHFNSIFDSIANGKILGHSYPFHFISLFCIALQMYVAHRQLDLKQLSEGLTENRKTLLVGLGIAIVFILSQELQLIIQNHYLSKSIVHSNLMEYNYIQSQISKIGFPILWALLSIGYLKYGIKKRNKPMRLLALALQAVTLLKLFIYDIRDVSEAGKIVAFIILGIVLLVMSFLYQKIKTILFNNEENPE